jgi:hypothetical protein
MPSDDGLRVERFSQELEPFMISLQKDREDPSRLLNRYGKNRRA